MRFCDALYLCVPSDCSTDNVIQILLHRAEIRPLKRHLNVGVGLSERAACLLKYYHIFPFFN